MLPTKLEIGYDFSTFLTEMRIFFIFQEWFGFHMSVRMAPQLRSFTKFLTTLLTLDHEGI